MLDSIHVGMSGLLGYSQGLRVIANNTANLNTPGYKSSSLQFTDLFYTQSGANQGVQSGYGLGTAGTQINFKQGDLRQTGNDLDLGVDGQGFFVLRDAQGLIHYTRAGQFQFSPTGVLVSRIDGSTVLGMDAAGQQGPISLENLRVGPGQATTKIKLSGNLSSTVTEQSVGSIKVLDALGNERTLSVKFTNDSATTPGQWKVELLSGTTVLDTSSLTFEDGKPSADTSKLTFRFTLQGQSERELTLDFSSDVTSYASGNLSTLAASTQDGYAPGALTGVTFDAKGTLVASYSNGQTVKGARLLLGHFDSPDAAQAAGENRFDEAHGRSWMVGVAGEGVFGSVRSGVLEISNVDLSQEFSDLVIMQRGYQASSQVVSTANDMLQELFGMKR